MNRGQGRWVLLTLLGVIALASGEWVGEGGLGLEGMNIVMALSLVLVVLVIALLLLRSRINRSATTNTVVALSALCLAGVWSGHVGAVRAFNDCVRRGEEVRVALSKYQAQHGRYPSSLADLEQSSLPGHRLLRGTILKYQSNGSSYRVEFGDWLTVHYATQDDEFMGFQ